MTMSTAMQLAFSLPALVAATAALLLGGVLLAAVRSSRFHRSLAAALGAASLTQLANALSVLDPSHVLEWQRLALAGELLFPAALFHAGLAFLSQAEGPDATARWRALVITVLAGLFAGLGLSDLVYADIGSDEQVWWLVKGPLGRVCDVFILLTLVLGMAQLEQIMRVTRDPVRYQLKFVVIGLGALAGYGIYRTSQHLLAPVWRGDYIMVGSVALLVATGLIAYGLGRCRLQEIKARVYISQQVLYGSLTFIVTGAYLVTLGVVGEVVRYTGYSLGVMLSTAIMFVGLVGLVVLLYSRAFRTELRRLTVRHFYRSKYDYRAKWLEVTEAFRACPSVEAILDRLIHLMGETFGAARITVWMRYETDGRFHLVRKINTEPAPHPLDAAHPVVIRLLATDEPQALEAASAEASAKADPFLDMTRAALAVPIRSIDGLIAFLTLSREARSDGYGADDCDLLRGIAHHVGALLSQAGLAEQRRVAGELEALHRFSAFCLHDLKNLAAGLSLVVKNAQVHGRDPAFQQSAMRTIARTAQKMMALMTKLSLKSQPLGSSEPVDVHAALAEAMESLNGGLRAPVRHDGERVPPVLIGRDQFQQVLLNVILNAQQAMGEQGEIRIRTERRDGFVSITVSDTGCGIPSEGLRTLFQPFRTTKSGGLGIGLYQCKRIVEAHRGTIHVDSQVGRGTSVQIILPSDRARPARQASARQSRAGQERVAI